MGTHVAAFLITLFAYRYSRKHADNPDFTFGPGKINVLGGFASAVALAVVALIMAVESFGRFFSPVEIHYGQSMLVAGVSLAANIFSAFLLHGSHSHDEHHHYHEDHNLKATYSHVLANALTSVLAIVALLFGSLFGWWILYPLMGIIGALVTHYPRPTEKDQQLLAEFEQIKHITIEVIHCQNEPCIVLEQHSLCVPLKEMPS